MISDMTRLCLKDSMFFPPFSIGRLFDKLVVVLDHRSRPCKRVGYTLHPCAEFIGRLFKARRPIASVFASLQVSAVSFGDVARNRSQRFRCAAVIFHFS